MSETNENIQKALQMPAAPEAERNVLGAMLLDPDSIETALELLSEDSFFDRTNRTVFAAIVRLYNQQQPIDPSTVWEELKRGNKGSRVDWSEVVMNLTHQVSSSARIDFFSKVLVEKSILRALIKSSQKIVHESYEGSKDAFGLLDMSQQAIFEISAMHLKSTYQDMGRAVKNAMDYLMAMSQQHTNDQAVPSGYIDMESMLGGFHKSDLIILAARPSMGKTALALSFARNAAVMYGIPILVFSLEMSTLQLVVRLLCAEARINAHQARTGRLTAEQLAVLPINASKLIKANIYIDDQPVQTMLDIRAKSRRLVRDKGVGMIVVDYLQLISSAQKYDSREREISEISRSLKQLAKELNVPVLALAQLNRAVEARKDRRPLLSDLRESGSIEQDADVVMFINRPEVYEPEEEIQKRNLSGLAEIIIAKHRNGPTGDVNLRFLKDYARFENADKFDRNPELEQGSYKPQQEDSLKPW